MSFTGLAFLIAFATGCMLAFGRRPIYGLIAYLGAFYLHPPSKWWGQGMLLEVRWAYIAAVVTLLAVLIRKPAGPTVAIFRSGAFWTLIVFVGWLAMQSMWALDSAAHKDLLEIYLKFIVVLALVYKCIDSEQDLRLFLWAHVLGCFYLGWLAYTTYAGGRFEEFGGPGLGEANAAALQMVTGIFVAGSLLMTESVRSKIALFGIIPILVNGLVTTISRSGFLAAGVGGLVYNLFTPSIYRKRVRVLSVLAVVLFALLTNPVYWVRIGTIKQVGEKVEGVDTGSGRLEILQKQWLMFKAHPLGCGHMCTTELSPSYMDPSLLSGGARASHNTFMTMLVDHGVPGGAFYIASLFWIYRSLRVVGRRLRGESGFLPAVLPAVGAVLAAITVGDLFVQYPKFEARFWFVGLLLVLLHLTGRGKTTGGAT